jgi:hypothetical protein
MVKAGSKPLHSTTDDWTPLVVAFPHIQRVLGGGQLAAEDLRLRLLSGDVEAQDRWVTPGEGIEIIPLGRKDFEGLEVRAEADGVSFRASLGESVCDDLGGMSVPRFSPQHGHNIFLRHVYRVWPSASDGGKPRRVALPATRPKGIGPKVWLAAQEVYALRREGGKWIDIEHDLLSQIQARLGGVVWLRSPTTLKTAVAYLRRKRLIDL